MDNLANFLSISPNQTKFLLSVCLDNSAIPVSISAVSLGIKAINLYTFQILRLLMGSYLPETFFKSFSRTGNMFISVFMIQILQQLNF